MWRSRLTAARIHTGVLCTTLFAAGLIALAPSCLAAQVGKRPQPLHAGQQVRLTTNDYLTVIGRFSHVRGDSIHLLTRDVERAIPVSAVVRLEAAVGRNRARPALYGGIGGALAGGILLGVLSASGGPGDYGSTEGAFGYGVLIGAPLGALIGAATGAMIGSTRWQSLAPSDIRPAR